jgi:ribosome biogenesis GTPase A
MADIQKRINKAEKGKRTILLIGATDSGKSTLGNVLINRNGNFEKVFVEGEFNVSETKNIKSVNVKIEGINCRIIDTPGFGDTSFEAIKILPTLGELNEYIRTGIDCIFIVVKKFTNINLDIIKYLKEIFFEDDVIKYITIIFTHFLRFREEEICESPIKNKCPENVKKMSGK